MLVHTFIMPLGVYKKPCRADSREGNVEQSGAAALPDLTVPTRRDLK